MRLLKACRFSTAIVAIKFVYPQRLKYQSPLKSKLLVSCKLQNMRVDHGFMAEHTFRGGTCRAHNVK